MDGADCTTRAKVASSASSIASWLLNSQTRTGKNVSFSRWAAMARQPSSAIARAFFKYWNFALTRHDQSQTLPLEHLPAIRRIPSPFQMDRNRKEFSGTSSPASARLQLYSYWQSSCSWRVRFALNLKGLSYEYKTIDLSKGEQFSPEFRHLNPMSFVPVLVDGDLVVSDSFAILMYLEENYPQNALLPVDIKRRTVNLQAASIVGSSIQPLQMQSVLKYIEEKLSPDEKLLWAQHYVVKGFTALEQLLETFAGKYATGDEVFMADVFLAPQISLATSRFNIEMSLFPTLNRINEAYKVLPAFQASLPERQPDTVIS